MSRIYSFPPIVDETSKILILESVPGVKSLQMQQYYAHPQNAFWKIMFEVFQEDFCVDYNNRLSLLMKNKIALWDVIESCERKGSKDTDIKLEVNNDIPKLLTTFPNIQKVLCNGQKSYKNLKKLFSHQLEIPVVVMPSTSPLHTIPYETKLLAWKQGLQF